MTKECMHTKDMKDGGWGWVVCLASSWTNGVIFGIINSFGVLYVFMLDLDGATAFKTSWIGSVCAGLTFFMMPFASIITDKFGSRRTAVIGSTLALIGILVSSFITRLEYMYITYGFVMGMGFAIAYQPSLYILCIYFHKRLGLANGLVCFGSAIFTVVLPIAMKELLSNHGLQACLWFQSSIVFVMLFAGLTYLPRSEETDRTKSTKSSRPCAMFDLSIWKVRNYRIWAIGVPLGLVGYFVPFFHLVKHVNDILPEARGEVLIMCLGATSGVGRLVAGLISDHPKLNPIHIQQMAFLVIGVCTILIPVIHNFIGLCVLILVMGLFDGAFVSMMGLIAVKLVGQKRASQAIGVIFGLTSIPMMIGGPPVMARLKLEIMDGDDVHNRLVKGGNAIETKGVQKENTEVRNERQHKQVTMEEKNDGKMEWEYTENKVMERRHFDMESPAMRNKQDSFFLEEEEEEEAKVKMDKVDEGESEGNKMVTELVQNEKVNNKNTNPEEEKETSNLTNEKEHDMRNVEKSPSYLQGPMTSDSNKFLENEKDTDTKAEENKTGDQENIGIEKDNVHDFEKDDMTTDMTTCDELIALNVTEPNADASARSKEQYNENHSVAEKSPDDVTTTDNTYGDTKKTDGDLEKEMMGNGNDNKMSDKESVTHDDDGYDVKIMKKSDQTTVHDNRMSCTTIFDEHHRSSAWNGPDIIDSENRQAGNSKDFIVSGVGNKTMNQNRNIQMKMKNEIQYIGVAGHGNDVGKGSEQTPFDKESEDPRNLTRNEFQNEEMDATKTSEEDPNYFTETLNSPVSSDSKRIQEVRIPEVMNSNVDIKMMTQERDNTSNAMGSKGQAARETEKENEKKCDVINSEEIIDKICQTKSGIDEGKSRNTPALDAPKFGNIERVPAFRETNRSNNDVNIDEEKLEPDKTIIIGIKTDDVVECNELAAEDKKQEEEKSHLDTGYEWFPESGHVGGTVRHHIVITILICLTLASCTSSQDGNDNQPISLWQGSNATIPFSSQWQPDETSLPSVTLRFESFKHPFAVNDILQLAGFKSSSQLDRFKVISSISSQSLSVNINIVSVSVHDQGKYVMTLTLYGSKDTFQQTTVQTIQVIVPPGRARCYITVSEFKDFKELHCHASSGNINSTLNCFQNNQHVPYKGAIIRNKITTKGVFWMDPYTPISCCSHIEQNVSQAICNDYQWHPEKGPTSVAPHGTKKPDINTTALYPADSGSFARNKLSQVAFFVISLLAHIVIHTFINMP